MHQDAKSAYGVFKFTKNFKSLLIHERLTTINLTPYSLAIIRPIENNILRSSRRDNLNHLFHKNILGLIFWGCRHMNKFVTPPLKHLSYRTFPNSIHALQD